MGTDLAGPSSGSISMDFVCKSSLSNDIIITYNMTCIMIRSTHAKPEAGGRRDRACTVQP